VTFRHSRSNLGHSPKLLGRQMSSRRYLGAPMGRLQGGKCKGEGEENSTLASRTLLRPHRKRLRQGDL